MTDELDKIAASQRLATRKMHLEDTQHSRLGEHPLPRCRVELGACALKVQRVRAIGTAQRAAMGQLGEQR
jgi:hypothetical protein